MLGEYLQGREARKDNEKAPSFASHSGGDANPFNVAFAP